jgi:ABC-type antimicrobial peptide transport system permease subunit
MARRFFGNAPAVGRPIRVIDRAGRERSATVVGVARDVKTRFMGESPRPFAYLPIGQWYRSDMVLHVRVAPNSSPDEVRKAVIEQIHRLEPNLAVEAESMVSATSFSLIPLRVAAAVLGFAGVVGLLLACIGVFGLVAYAVSLRTREIGIRMALGAGPKAVLQLIAGQGLRPVAAGLVVGFALSLAAGQLLRGLLVSIGPNDPASMLLVTAVLFASAAAALWVPVRRAVRVDPANALRAD